MNEKYKARLNNILNKNVWNTFGHDGEIQVAISLIHLNKLDTYIYGAGKMVDNLIRFLAFEGVSVKAIIDIDQSKNGTEIEGVPVLTPENIEINRESKNFCFIWTLAFTGLAQNDIIEILFDNNIFQFLALKEDDRLGIKGTTTPNFDSDRCGYYKEHERELCDLIDMLSDVKSIEIMLEYIRAYCENDVYRLPQTPTRNKYFFGDINQDDENEILYTHLKDEVWLNCGANVGDTIFLFLRLGVEFKKIFAVEGDSQTYLSLKNNLKRLSDSYREKIESYNIFIDKETNFSKMLGGEKITFLNADIEGFERNLVESMASVIRNDMPVIAICVYHNKEDLLDIAKILKTISSDYNLYLRKYSPWHFNINRTGELVLYAVPNSRCV